MRLSAYKLFEKKEIELTVTENTPDLWGSSTHSSPASKASFRGLPVDALTNNDHHFLPVGVPTQEDLALQVSVSPADRFCHTCREVNLRYENIKMIKYGDIEIEQNERCLCALYRDGC